MKLMEVNNHENLEGGSASLIFRVRCETLGQGESIYMVRADDPLNLVSVHVSNLCNTGTCDGTTVLRCVRAAV
jgi:hypothetical protein